MYTIITNNIIQDAEGRYIIVVGMVGGIKISILNIYAQNKDYPHFFYKIANMSVERGEGLMLLRGEFNFIVNTLDKLFITAKSRPRMSKS